MTTNATVAIVRSIRNRKEARLLLSDLALQSHLASKVEARFIKSVVSKLLTLGFIEIKRESIEAPRVYHITAEGRKALAMMSVMFQLSQTCNVAKIDALKKSLYALE